MNHFFYIKHGCMALAMHCFFPAVSISQVQNFDTAQIASPAALATATFIKATAAEKEVYNGLEHIGYATSIDGVAYYASKDWQPGMVQYDGIVYRNEQLLFDLVKDKLVIKRPDGFAVEVRSDKVDWFTLGQRLFIAVRSGNNIKPGFHEQLAGGEITLLARHEKVYEEPIEEARVHPKFTPYTSYYALLKNESHSLRNLKSLLSLMGSKRSAVQQQMKKSGLHFKHDPEATLAAAARFYNQISL